jgi:HK97 family phage major capsid protein
MTIEELRKAIEALLAEVRAVQAQAKEENRDLTEDEETSIDEKMDKIDEHRAEIQKKEKAEKRNARIDDAQNALNATTRQTTGSVRTAIPDPDDGDTEPARPRALGTLRAFKDDEAQAYRFGRWIQASFLGDERASVYCDRNVADWRECRAMAGTGNFSSTVPTEFESTIIKLMEGYGVAMREARVIPMASDTLDIPRWTGDPTAYFAAENASLTASDPSSDQVTLTAKKIYTMTRCSTELVEDSVINVADEVAEGAARAMANKIDKCVFIGDGTSTYGGCVGITTQSGTDTGSQYTAVAGNIAYSDLDDGDFMGMAGKLPEFAQPGAKLYMSRQGFFASAARLQRASGGNTTVDLGNGPVMQYGSYPFVPVQIMNTTLTDQASTTGLAILGDLRQCVALGVRRGIRFQLLTELYAANDQVGFKVTQRFATSVNLNANGDSSTPGTMIVLVTPGS